ncbi:hypothetical protein AB1Y20_009710 [Prymnesium parvum]|uniref:Uncharacterized protein n=1 Tax=Prymnesium parvum TaxID=97485 RepID=A0AB34K559_PRYPA
MALQAADMIATDEEAREAVLSADVLRLSFPRNWPSIFQQPSRLKRFTGKAELGGVRCRAVRRAAFADQQAAAEAGVVVRPFDSFRNAAELQRSPLGWPVVQGFLVLELIAHEVDLSTSVRDVSEVSAGKAFVAFRHHWNRKPDGTWVDLTPAFIHQASDAQSLLVESVKGARPTPPPPVSDGFGPGLLRRTAPSAPASSSPTSTAEGRASLRAPANPRRRGIEIARWDQVVKEEEAKEATADRARQTENETLMRQELARAQQLIQEAHTRREKQTQSTIDELKPKFKELGLMTMPREDLCEFGRASESEQEKIDRHEEQVRMAKQRLEKGLNKSKFDELADQMLLEEESPKAPVKEFLMQAMSKPKEETYCEDENETGEERLGLDAHKKLQGGTIKRDASEAETEAKTAEGKRCDEQRKDFFANLLQAAEVTKQAGNFSFKQGDDRDAICKYRDALSMLCVESAATQLLEAASEGESAGRPFASLPDGVTPAEVRRRSPHELLLALHSNMAACCLRTRQFHAAREAATAALVLSPTDLKARRRRAAALSAIGLHPAACDDMATALKAAAGRKAQREVAASMCEAWALRAPAARGYIEETAGGADGAAAAVALSHALAGRGTARQWAARAGDAVFALARASSALLVDAALECASNDDAGGAAGLLRCAAWLIGPRGTLAAEEALIEAVNAHFSQLVLADEQVVVASLQLVEALARRRVANVARLLLPQLLQLWRNGRTAKVRVAANEALIWCTRCPFTNEWMQDAKQVELEPVLLKVVSYQKSCDVKGGWALRVEDEMAYTTETGIFLGDGS